MIASVVRIKQHRTQSRSRQVRSSQATLADKQAQRAESARALQAFVQWQSEEEHRLFSELSKKPATLVEVEAFNQAVSDLNSRKKELAQHLQQMDTEVAAAEEALREAITELKTAERMQQKFEHLADELHLAQRKEKERVEQNLADEIATECSSAGVGIKSYCS